MSQKPGTCRRIVTGHDNEGHAIIISDAVAEHTFMIGGPNGAKFHELWNTKQTPALINRVPEELEDTTLILPPPKGGTRIRVIDFPAEGDEIRKLTSEQAGQHFKAMGDEKASSAQANAPHPLMHRTQTIDYGIVLEGEITLIVDRGETVIKAGDIVIQRGTNHAWANRSGKSCRMAFILIDGQFVNELK